MADAWQDFWEKIYKPAGVMPGSVPYIECRRAFYGGAISFMGLLGGETDRGPDLTQLDLEYIDLLQAEFDQYAIDLAEGRA